MHTILLKVSTLLVALSLPLAAFCQREAKVVYLKNSPVVNGYTLTAVDTAPKKQTGIIDLTVEIYSEQPDVSSLNDGIVTSVFFLSNNYIVMINAGDSFFVYENINQAVVKQGDHVLKGNKIGMLAQAPIDLVYKLGLQIWIPSKDKPEAMDPGLVIGYLAKSDK